MTLIGEFINTVSVSDVKRRITNSSSCLACNSEFYAQSPPQSTVDPVDKHYKYDKTMKNATVCYKQDLIVIQIIHTFSLSRKNRTDMPLCANVLRHAFHLDLKQHKLQMISSSTSGTFNL